MTESNHKILCAWILFCGDDDLFSNSQNKIRKANLTDWLREQAKENLAKRASDPESFRRARMLISSLMSIVA